MKARYQDADIYDLLHQVRVNHFPELKNASIKTLFDTKKSVHQGAVKLGCILRPNDLLQHFAAKEADEYQGYDYIIILDKVCWESIQNEDRERILRHELRHCWFDIESDKDPFKLVDHEVTDFYAEIEANANDPKWRQRLAALTIELYEVKKEEAKEIRSKKKRTKESFQNMNLEPGAKTPIEEYAEERGAAKGLMEDKEAVGGVMKNNIERGGVRL